MDEVQTGVGTTGYMWYAIARALLVYVCMHAYVRACL